VSSLNCGRLLSSARDLIGFGLDGDGIRDMRELSSAKFLDQLPEALSSIKIELGRNRSACD
jgi:hypothetical protein